MEHAVQHEIYKNYSVLTVTIIKNFRYLGASWLVRKSVSFETSRQLESFRKTSTTLHLSTSIKTTYLTFYMTPGHTIRILGIE